MRQHLACVLACAICKVIGIFRCIPDGRNLLHKLLNAFTLRACGRTGGIGLAVIIKAEHILRSPGYEAGCVGSGFVFGKSLVFARFFNIRRGFQKLLDRVLLLLRSGFQLIFPRKI